jgi:Carbohydrate-selective porin, OprB family
VLRVQSFVNHANMDDYRTAVDNFLAGSTPTPEITAHPLQTTVKPGFGANFEQPLNDWFGVFGRWGWNEGRHESYAYTEVDSTAETGAGASGRGWGRNYDHGGFAFASNGISRDHQECLALGGLGFSVWRRPIELWPRKHCGDVLYDAYVARILSLFLIFNLWIIRDTTGIAGRCSRRRCACISSFD